MTPKVPSSDTGIVIAGTNEAVTDIDGDGNTLFVGFHSDGHAYRVTYDVDTGSFNTVMSVTVSAAASETIR